MAPVFRLGFNNAHGLLVDEQHIIGGADGGLVFTHRDAGAGAEVDGLVVLDHPASQRELAINLIAGFLFRGLVVTAHADSLLCAIWCFRVNYSINRGFSLLRRTGWRRCGGRRPPGVDGAPALDNAGIMPRRGVREPRYSVG